jgi:hypothetical protein
VPETGENRCPGQFSAKIEIISADFAGGGGLPFGVHLSGDDLPVFLQRDDLFSLNFTFGHFHKFPE